MGDLAELVRLESPSRDKDALDALEDVLADRLRMLSEPRSRSSPMRTEATTSSADFLGPAELRPALVLGHFDTVWPRGTLERMPFRVERRPRVRARDLRHEGQPGDVPGVMEQLRKNVGAGAAAADLGACSPRDEEIGSPTSRALIEELAIESAYVLVLEPALADGGLKTSRKGVGRFRLEVEGKAAHAGVAPEDGRSAIVELAHQVLKLQTLQDLAAGTTINVGVINGGTTTNVVPARASAEIDVRVASKAEEARIESALRSLVPVTPDTRLTVSGRFNRPPDGANSRHRVAVRASPAIGRELGLELTEGSTGGGSDGNFTAALGIPTLDGLGARGGGAHADDEHVLIDSLPERAALLAALLLDLQMD